MTYAPKNVSLILLDHLCNCANHDMFLLSSCKKSIFQIAYSEINSCLQTLWKEKRLQGLQHFQLKQIHYTFLINMS